MPKRKIAFVGGTRKVDRLPGEVLELLIDLIACKALFVVGDAPGSDRAFQKYLATNEVQDVNVYFSAPTIRGNIGGWNSYFVDSGLKTRSNAMHSAKDRRMSELCSEAIMIWDGQSAGTLANAIDVSEQKKLCYLYNYLDSEFIRFDTTESLLDYLAAFPEVTSEALRRLRRDRRRLKKAKVEKDKDAIRLF
jgi:hypothetical protein